ncbi:MAG: hypothetical protein DRJ05_09890 [Bacteroidetes bacterium]|nr:MAG: hypothetical protein DRJ05_09890 [Bacteroidota bacterium]
MKHRGRIQAQGENLEASEAWSKDDMPTKNDGLEMLDKLKNKIPRMEVKIRDRAFCKATNFIGQGPYEVVSSPIVRSFRVKGTKKERVDIEILSGRAFI